MNQNKGHNLFLVLPTLPWGLKSPREGTSRMDLPTEVLWVEHRWSEDQIGPLIYDGAGDI